MSTITISLRDKDYNRRKFILEIPNEMEHLFEEIVADASITIAHHTIHLKKTEVNEEGKYIKWI